MMHLESSTFLKGDLQVFFGFSLRNFSLRTSFTFAAWNAGNEMKKITEMLAESWHRQCALHKTNISHICKRKVVFVRQEITCQGVEGV